MEKITADHGALGENMVVVNHGPDDYVMEDNRIRIKPGEALACTRHPLFGAYGNGQSTLYKMSREEAEAWANAPESAPHCDDPERRRRLFHAYTHGTEYRAPVSWIEDDPMFKTVPNEILAYMPHKEIAELKDHYRFDYRTNYIGH